MKNDFKIYYKNIYNILRRGDGDVNRVKNETCINNLGVKKRGYTVTPATNK